MRKIGKGRSGDLYVEERVAEFRPPLSRMKTTYRAALLGDNHDARENNAASILTIYVDPSWLRETRSTPTSPPRTLTRTTRSRSASSHPPWRSFSSSPTTPPSLLTGLRDQGGVQRAKLGSPRGRTSEPSCSGACS